MVDLSLVERYRFVRVADVVDALDRYGFHERPVLSLEIRPEDVNTPVSIGGVTVNPYDLTVEDDGLTVVPRSIASQALES